MASKIIDAVVLRRKVHQEITRIATAHKPLSQYDKGFIDALARTEALIDKMAPVPQVIQSQTNVVQNGTGMCVGELHGDITIDYQEHKTVKVTQEAKEIYNIKHVEKLEV